MNTEPLYPTHPFVVASFLELQGQKTGCCWQIIYNCYNIVMLPIDHHSPSLVY